MANKRTQNPENSVLRGKAKQMSAGRSVQGSSQFNEDELLKLMQELEVHQIELQLQNEELKEARETAQEAIEKYIELFDFAPFGYFILTSEGQIIELNLTGAQMLGKERWHLKNSMFSFFVTNETRQIFNDFLDMVIKSNVKETCEVVIESADNECSYVQINGINIGQRSQYLINVSDITSRKMAEKAVIESHRLAAMGEMTSAITHDFNNSLQIITGNLELLMLDKTLPGSVHKYLNTIQTTLSDTVKRVRMLQRFGGKMEDHQQYLFENLNDIITDVIAQIQPLWKDEAERKGLSFNIVTQFGDISDIFCNKGEMRIVLYNILKNSVEAMPAGGEINIETKNLPQGIYISVADSGIGMNDETKLRIFQPFYSTKGLDIGRGLGMVSALAVIKEHGGKIQIKSTAPGKGTTMEITLPLLQKKDNPVKENPINISDTKKIISVLWVEDEEAINTIAEEMIKMLGHKIDTVNSGDEALKYLDRKRYDLVITDIGMPVMNGWQLADKIREKFGRKLKVVVASGWGHQISEAEKSKHGIDYMIDKPFNLSQLKDILDEVKNII